MRSPPPAGPGYVARAEKSSTDLRRPCGPSAGSVTPLLAYESFRCARSAARHFAPIWTTWIAESLAEDFRPGHAFVQLAARGVGLPPACIAHRHVQSLRRDQFLEPLHPGVRWRVEWRVFDRIERNEVDMGELAAQQPSKLLGVALRVVDAGKHHPLVADAPAGLLRISLGGVHQ